MNIVLFDTQQARKRLAPFSYTRSLAKIRVGITTIEEKWRYYLPGDYSFLTASYLSHKFPCVAAKRNLCINSTVCPDPWLLAAIRRLSPNQRLFQGDTSIAVFCDGEKLKNLSENSFIDPFLTNIAFEKSITQVKNKWDIWLLNETEIEKDFQWVCERRTTRRIADRHTIVYNREKIFLEENVSIKAAVLNAESGPIYLGRDVLIREGAVVKGPVAICRGAQINAGADIRGATTIGPYAKVGGEVHNTVILGYSNKAHSGFMGNSVIGEWCNLGAGTNTSNLRNDYGNIKVWDDHREDFEATNLQFCGIFMGDHSKCAINTMFKAGTVVGVSSNLFGLGFCSKVVPSFTWGMPGTSNTQTYLLNRALDAAERMTTRRLVSLTKEDKDILVSLFSTASIRK